LEARVKGSRFRAVACPVGGEEEARGRLVTLRSEFRDATHLCWALRLRVAGDDLERTHDAGEPAGTAGLPILQAIRAAQVSNVLVAVVRHYGGTKLGKGGLARAYRDATRGVLDAAPRREEVPLVTLRIVAPLERDGGMRHLVARHGGRVAGASYDRGAASLEIVLPAAAANRLRDDLTRLTSGACRFEIPVRVPSKRTSG